MGSLPSVAAITDNGTLAFNSSNTVTQGVKSSITGAGGLVQAGPGTLLLNGSNNYTGTTVINSGIVEFTTSGSLYGGNTLSWTASNITVASGTTVVVTIGGSNDFNPTGGAQAATLLNGLTTNPGSTACNWCANFGFDTTDSLASVLAQGVTASSSLFQNGAVLSTSIAPNQSAGFGISKYGTGTLVVTASNGYTGSTSVFNGELAMQGANSGTGSVLVANSTPQGISVLSIQNYHALGPGTLIKKLAAITLNASGGSLSSSILEIGATMPNDPGNNGADFAYQVVPAGTTPGNGQISLSLSASGGNNSGIGFAAYNATSLSTPRIVGLLTVNGITLQTLQEGTQFAAGNHLTLGSPTANNTLILLNPVDLNASSGTAGHSSSPRFAAWALCRRAGIPAPILNSNTAGAEALRQLQRQWRSDLRQSQFVLRGADAGA